MTIMELARWYVALGTVLASLGLLAWGWRHRSIQYIWPGILALFFMALFMWANLAFRLGIMHISANSINSLSMNVYVLLTSLGLAVTIALWVDQHNGKKS